MRFANVDFRAAGHPPSITLVVASIFQRDHSVAERALRVAALDRKNFMLLGSDAGGELKAQGWVMLRQEGSHVRMDKNNARTTVPLHGSCELKAGTLASIERQTGMKLK